MTSFDDLSGKRVETDPQRPLILVTNDDGIHAPGLEALAAALEPLGEVVVFAPARNRSGVSHLISLLEPLRGLQIRPGWWQVDDGSPADCVYLAIHELLDRRPQLVVSGINAGPNMSYDVHYSGTVGGAMEGTLMGVPSIASSLCYPPSGYATAARFTAEVARWVLEEGLPTDVMLNVNVPRGEPRRHQVTFLGHRLFKHSVERRDDPRGRPYYWIGGTPDAPDDLPGSDCTAIAEGLVSVTPLTVDLTHQEVLRGPLSGLCVAGSELVPGPRSPATPERRMAPPDPVNKP